MLRTAEMTVAKESLLIKSEILKREVAITLLIPDDYNFAEPLNLLLLNDGQETENLSLSKTLENLYQANKIKPVVAAAIHAGDERLLEYGIAGIPDFKGRGAKAELYTGFILDELLPQLYLHTSVKAFNKIAFAGFSLGGLTALDIAWNHSDIFGKVGVFSGSLWWRSKALNEGYTDADRIMHRVIRESKNKPALKFWLQTGTLDETADRNHNGIIDSIDDTIDLIKELEAKGYNRPADIQYLEVVGGRHDMPTWAKAMPKFLTWAFGKQA
ncbi:esterase [Mucilaginibacter sp. PPCGB 2223]|uniref:alpha/beta hydrolase n=1 Tax=Mucilaginibacter sp. PPCGB 2223 TaxID=1886027 RepID=UPI000825BE0D|nr:alpha/beta hydrolase-fold protein [Mucilaginibacter sp. PPCGB 2223]OCX50822.1 esterase [Mucilaginibacter sp. PPCGB 2223]